MDIRSLDRAGLGPENSFSQRLRPWQAADAPFQGAWCVVAAGTATTRHAHDEYEIFIALRGSAILESEGERTTFRTGDVVHFPPRHDHQVINEGAEDFEMYSVWWDGRMATEFVAGLGSDGS